MEVEQLLPVWREAAREAREASEPLLERPSCLRSYVRPIIQCFSCCMQDDRGGG